MTKQDSRAIQRCIGNLEEIQKRIREQIAAVDGVCSGARMKTFSENDPNGIGREIEQAEEGAIRLNAALASLREGFIFLQESIGAMIVPPHSIMLINEAQQCLHESIAIKLPPNSLFIIDETRQYFGASNKLPASKQKAGNSMPKSGAKKNVARPIVKEVQT